MKAYSTYDVNPHATKKELHKRRKPFYFPSYTPQELKGKKVVYILFLFPPEEVVADRLNNNNYDIGHIVPIINISKFLRGWRTDNEENIM